ncbi:MAG TPA: hypothetical protein DEQ77_05535, partial [Candidatus Omnitrophica bacterium]|nr:hypothetical protein [Candidatus Omnitrophota bacterium]
MLTITLFIPVIIAIAYSIIRTLFKFNALRKRSKLAVNAQNSNPPPPAPSMTLAVLEKLSGNDFVNNVDKVFPYVALGLKRLLTIQSNGAHILSVEQLKKIIEDTKVSMGALYAIFSDRALGYRVFVKAIKAALEDKFSGYLDEYGLTENIDDWKKLRLAKIDTTRKNYPLDIRKYIVEKMLERAREGLLVKADEATEDIKIDDEALDGLYISIRRSILKEKPGEQGSKKESGWVMVPARDIALTFIMQFVAGGQQAQQGFYEYMLKTVKRIENEKRTVSEFQIEKVGLNWSDVSKKLTENGWAEEINSTKVCLVANFYTEKGRMSEIFGNDFEKFLPILQQSSLHTGWLKEIIDIFRDESIVANMLLQVELNEILSDRIRKTTGFEWRYTLQEETWNLLYAYLDYNDPFEALGINWGYLKNLAIERDANGIEKKLKDVLSTLYNIKVLKEKDGTALRDLADSRPLSKRLFSLILIGLKPEQRSLFLHELVDSKFVAYLLGQFKGRLTKQELRTAIKTIEKNTGINNNNLLTVITSLSDYEFVPEPILKTCKAANDDLKAEIEKVENNKKIFISTFPKKYIRPLRILNFWPNTIKWVLIAITSVAVAKLFLMGYLLTIVNTVMPNIAPIFITTFGGSILVSQAFNTLFIVGALVIPVFLTAMFVGFAWELINKIVHKRVNSRIREFVAKNTRGKPGFINSLLEVHLDPRVKGHKDAERKIYTGMSEERWKELAEEKKDRVTQGVKYYLRMFGWIVPRMALMLLVLMWVFSEPAERLAVGLDGVLHWLTVIPLLHSIWLLFAFLMIRAVNSWGTWLVSRKAHREVGRYTVATDSELQLGLKLIGGESTASKYTQLVFLKVKPLEFVSLLLNLSLYGLQYFGYLPAFGVVSAYLPFVSLGLFIAASFAYLLKNTFKAYEIKKRFGFHNFRLKGETNDSKSMGRAKVRYAQVLNKWLLTKKISVQQYRQLLKYELPKDLISEMQDELRWFLNIYFTEGTPEGVPELELYFEEAPHIIDQVSGFTEPVGLAWDDCVKFIAEKEDAQGNKSAKEAAIAYPTLLYYCVVLTYPQEWQNLIEMLFIDGYIKDKKDKDTLLNAKFESPNAADDIIKNLNLTDKEKELLKGKIVEWVNFTQTSLLRAVETNKINREVLRNWWEDELGSGIYNDLRKKFGPERDTVTGSEKPARIALRNKIDNTLDALVTLIGEANPKYAALRNELARRLWVSLNYLNDSEFEDFFSAGNFDIEETEYLRADRFLEQAIDERHKVNFNAMGWGGLDAGKKKGLREYAQKPENIHSVNLNGPEMGGLFPEYSWAELNNPNLEHPYKLKDKTLIESLISIYKNGEWKRFVEDWLVKEGFVANDILKNNLLAGNLSGIDDKVQKEIEQWANIHPKFDKFTTKAAPEWVVAMLTGRLRFGEANAQYKAMGWVINFRYIPSVVLYADAAHHRTYHRSMFLPNVISQFNKPEYGSLLMAMDVISPDATKVRQGFRISETTWTFMVQEANRKKGKNLFYGRGGGAKADLQLRPRKPFATDYKYLWNMPAITLPYTLVAEDAYFVLLMANEGPEVYYTQAINYYGGKGESIGLNTDPEEKYIGDQEELETMLGFMRFAISPNVPLNEKYSVQNTPGSFYGLKSAVMIANVIFNIFAIVLPINPAHSFPISWIFILTSYSMSMAINFASVALYNLRYGSPKGLFKFAKGTIYDPGYYWIFTLLIPMYVNAFNRRGLKGVFDFRISKREAASNRESYGLLLLRHIFGARFAAPVLLAILLFAPYHPMIFFVVSPLFIFMMYNWVGGMFIYNPLYNVGRKSSNIVPIIFGIAGLAIAGFFGYYALTGILGVWALMKMKDIIKGKAFLGKPTSADTAMLMFLGVYSVFVPVPTLFIVVGWLFFEAHRRARVKEMFFGICFIIHQAVKDVLILGAGIKQNNNQKLKIEIAGKKEEADCSMVKVFGISLKPAPIKYFSEAAVYKAYIQGGQVGASNIDAVWNPIVANAGKYKWYFWSAVISLTFMLFGTNLLGLLGIASVWSSHIWIGILIAGPISSIIKYVKYIQLKKAILNKLDKFFAKHPPVYAVYTETVLAHRIGVALSDAMTKKAFKEAADTLTHWND